MSSVVIGGDTSGSVTLQAPAVAGSTVLTLPATSGTVITTASGTASSATTATNLANGSAGTIPYQSSSSTTAMLSAGTSGQVLTSGGAGAPTWTTPSAGALVYLSTVTASNSATVDIETTFSSTYDAYLLVVSNLVVGNDNATLVGRFKLNGAYVTTSTYYGKLMNLVSTTGTFNADNTNGLTAFYIGTNLGADTSDIAGFNINIYNPSSTTKQKRVVFSGVASASSGVGASQTTTFFGSGSNSGTGAMTGLRLFMNSGNITSGTFRLYGIANS